MMDIAFALASAFSVAGNFLDWRTTALDIKAKLATEGNGLPAWLMKHHIWDATKLSFIFAVDAAIWYFIYPMYPVRAITSLVTVGLLFGGAAWSNWQIFHGKPGIIELVKKWTAK